MHKHDWVVCVFSKPQSGPHFMYYFMIQKMRLIYFHSGNLSLHIYWVLGGFLKTIRLDLLFYGRAKEDSN